MKIIPFDLEGIGKVYSLFLCSKNQHYIRFQCHSLGIKYIARVPLLELPVSHPNLFVILLDCQRSSYSSSLSTSLLYCFLLDRSCSLCVWGDYFQKRIKVTLCFPSLYLQSSSNWQSWYFIPLPLPVGTKTNHNMDYFTKRFDEQGKSLLVDYLTTMFIVV